jgi:Sortase domain
MRPARRAGRSGGGRRRLAAGIVLGLGLAAGTVGLGLHAGLPRGGGAIAAFAGNTVRPSAPGPADSLSAPRGAEATTGRGGPTTTAGTPATGGGLATTAGRAPAASLPARLRIPAIGLAVPLSTLGLNPDRTVEVPTDFRQAGWFRLGPAPGQPGSAVILGHVDSYRGPAVFYQLGALRAGDRIEVTRADGALATFRVRAVSSYLKRDFPARQVYGSHGGRSLQLVTCGGAFDRAARSYLSNIVVYSELVSIIPAHG